jgi:hypothetical protein
VPGERKPGEVKLASILEGTLTSISNFPSPKLLLTSKIILKPHIERLDKILILGSDLYFLAVHWLILQHLKMGNFAFPSWQQISGHRVSAV